MLSLPPPLVASSKVGESKTETRTVELKFNLIILKHSFVRISNKANRAGKGELKSVFPLYLILIALLKVLKRAVLQMLAMPRAYQVD